MKEEDAGVYIHLPFLWHASLIQRADPSRTADIFSTPQNIRSTVELDYTRIRIVEDNINTPKSLFIHNQEIFSRIRLYNAQPSLSISTISIMSSNPIHTSPIQPTQHPSHTNTDTAEHQTQDQNQSGKSASLPETAKQEIVFNVTRVGGDEVHMRGGKSKWDDESGGECCCAVM